MRSPQSNPAELKAINAALQPAPFPLTPSAAALKAAHAEKLAALKRKALEEEDKEKITDSAEGDTEGGDKIVAEDGIASEGAALEAIAPAPLPEMSGLDTLLAQAGPAATGGTGGAAGIGGGAAAAIGGAVLLVAAAAGGGGSSSPAPAPAPAPAGPPNQPASINASEPQRYGEVWEDDEDGGFVTNGVAAALKVTDADGGADLAFRAATAEELDGKYGDFTFDAATGVWTYTLDNADPDTQALNDGYRTKDIRDMDADGAFDLLTVYSADGTASTVIAVQIYGNTDDPVLTEREFTVEAGKMVVLDLTAQDPLGIDYYEVNEDGVWEYEDGGFALYFASSDFDEPYTDEVYYSVYNNHGESAGGYVSVNVVAPSDEAENYNSPYFDGEFILDLTEGQASEISFLGNFYDQWDEDNPDGLYTLVLEADYLYEDGYFVLDAVAGVTTFGSGTSQVAIQGTLDALNDYVDDGHLKLQINTEESGWDVYFEAYLFDEYGAYDDLYGYGGDSEDFNLYFFEEVNDLPELEVYAFGDDDDDVFSIMDDGWDRGILMPNPVIYVPATGEFEGESSFSLNDTWYQVYLYDEEAYENDNYVYVTLSVAGGDVSGSLSYYDDYDGVWDVSISEDGTEMSFYGYLESVEDFINDSVTYTAPEAFAVGATDTLTMTVEDGDDGSVSQVFSLVAAVQDQAPFLSLTTDNPFMNFTIVDEDMNTDGFWASNYTAATAELHEDQAITLTGIAINDPDAQGSDSVYVYFEAYEFYMDGDTKCYDGDLGLFYVDDAYVELIDSQNGSFIEFYGSIDDINAMLAAGGLHFLPPPDYDSNISGEGDGYGMGMNIGVFDLGNRGYGEGEAFLELDITIIGVNDVPLVLEEASQNSTLDSDGIWLYRENLLDGDAIFDAEYHGNGSDGELDITSVLLVDGTGTVTMEDGEDGGWMYTPGEGDMAGDTIEFSYTVSDGTYSVTNTLNLMLQEPMMG